MAANLLSSLYHEIIQADQMQKGFKSLLNSVDDLKLDVPSAEDDLALFLARGVIDDILPPAFLHKLPCGEHRSSSCAVLLLDNTCVGRQIDDILPPAFLHKLPCGETRSSSCMVTTHVRGAFLHKVPCGEHGSSSCVSDNTCVGRCIDDILPPAFLHKLPCGETRSSSCVDDNICVGRFIADILPPAFLHKLPCGEHHSSSSSSCIGDNTASGDKSQLGMGFIPIGCNSPALVTTHVSGDVLMTSCLFAQTALQGALFFFLHRLQHIYRVPSCTNFPAVSPVLLLALVTTSEWETYQVGMRYVPIYLP